LFVWKEEIMNLRVLTTPTMLALSEGWLSDTETRNEVTVHPLGAAAFDHLHGTFHELAQQHHLCDHIAAEIARLTGELQALGADHTRKARAFHNHLDALADATNEPERAARYQELKAYFLPRGLSVTKRSYMEIAGATVGLQHRATPERMAELESIPVGEHTLAHVLRDWIAAGKAIGGHVQQRARLEASISRHGTVAARAGKARLRNKWIRALRLLIGAMEELPLSKRTRERFWAPLAEWLDTREQPPSSSSSKPSVPSVPAKHEGAEPGPGPIDGAPSAPMARAGASLAHATPGPTTRRPATIITTEAVTTEPARRADAALDHGASPPRHEHTRHERAPGDLTRPRAIIPLLEPFATDSPERSP
jgi:hypothetical protein